MFTPDQLAEYYPDLCDPYLKSAIALVHSRFSTNTFPTWDLAQPFRYLAHNGEINTIKGNRLWMHARESLLKSELFGEDLKKLFPIIEPGKSDSASLDNVLEFLALTGRTIPHAMSMLIPESWNDKNPIPNSLKAFYEYHLKCYMAERFMLQILDFPQICISDYGRPEFNKFTMF